MAWEAQHTCYDSSKNEAWSKWPAALWYHWQKTSLTLCYPAGQPAAVSSHTEARPVTADQHRQDKHITASVLTTTITRRSLPTHASNMCGCAPIDLHVSGLNFWLWLWAANFFPSIIMEIVLWVAACCLPAIKMLSTW